MARRHQSASTLACSAILWSLLALVPSALADCNVGERVVKDGTTLRLLSTSGDNCTIYECGGGILEAFPRECFVPMCDEEPVFNSNLDDCCLTCPAGANCRVPDTETIIPASEGPVIVDNRKCTCPEQGEDLYSQRTSSHYTAVCETLCTTDDGTVYENLGPGGVISIRCGQCMCDESYDVVCTVNDACTSCNAGEYRPYMENDCCPPCVPIPSE